MSDPATPGIVPRVSLGRWLKRLVVVGLILFVLAFLLDPFLLGVPFQLLDPLAIGWWRFLGRTVPAIHWNWDLLAMGMVCLVLVLLGSQWFLKWLCRGSEPLRKALALQTWPWKWTYCGLAAMAVLFLVGMSVGGIVHQLGWLAAEPTPMIEAKRYASEDINNLRQLEGAFQQAALETKGDIGAMRPLIWGNPESYFRPGMSAKYHDGYHVLAIVGPDGKLAGSLIFPRDLKRRARAGCHYSFGSESALENEQRLLELLKRHQPDLVSL